MVKRLIGAGQVRLLVADYDKVRRGVQSRATER